MTTFIPGKTVLVMAIVVIAHLGLLSLLLGQAPESIHKPMQAPVIQGMLIAPAPPKPQPEPPRKVAPKPEPKPKPKPKPLAQKAKTAEAPTIIEAPLAQAVEPAVESEPKITPEKALPAEEPIPQPIETAPQTAEIAEVIPPRKDAYQHNNPKPRYPRLSKRLREEGTVLLLLLINKNGTVNEVAIKKSSGYPRLDRAAIKAVKQWHYTPASRGNETIAYRYEQPVRFSMN